MLFLKIGLDSHSGVYKWRFSWNSASPKGLLRCKFSPTKRKRQGPTKQQEKQFRTSRAPTVKRPVLERLAGISAQDCLNARGEWDHFIYSESAYITVVTLNCPCCNGKCVPKLKGINRMIDERSHEPRFGPRLAPVNSFTHMLRCERVANEIILSILNRLM